MLGIKESLHRMAKASTIKQWYGHVLRKEDENAIVKALKFEVSGSRGRRRRLKQTWKESNNIYFVYLFQLWQSFITSIGQNFIK